MAGAARPGPQPRGGTTPLRVSWCRPYGLSADCRAIRRRRGDTHHPTDRPGLRTDPPQTGVAGVRRRRDPGGVGLPRPCHPDRAGPPGRARPPGPPGRAVRRRRIPAARSGRDRRPAGRTAVRHSPGRTGFARRGVPAGPRLPPGPGADVRPAPADRRRRRRPHRDRRAAALRLPARRLLRRRARRPRRDVRRLPPGHGRHGRGHGGVGRRQGARRGGGRAQARRPAPHRGGRPRRRRLRRPNSSSPATARGTASTTAPRSCPDTADTASAAG